MTTRSNPYGVTTALRSGTQKINPQLVTDFTTLNLGWVRLMVLWSNIEKSPGVYDPTALDVIDDAVHRCNQAGLHVQFPIQQPPSFHQVSTNCCPSGCTTSGPWFMPDPTSVGNFAGFLANRYNGITNVPGYGTLFIDSFEVGNEEYDVHFCKGCATDVANQPCRLAKWFIPCLQAASPKIRTNSPNSSIGMNAMWWEFTPHHQEFMNDLYATPGISQLFDYANMHFYSGTVYADQDTNSTRLSLGGQVNEVYNIMAANGDGKKNVWITEWGYTTANMTDQTRISYMNKFLDVARTNGHVGVVNYFTMNYVDPAINANVQQFSLTQFNAPHYTQSFTGYQNYITSNPPSSWPSGGGCVRGGCGGGGGASFAVSPPTLTFTATVGGANPASQSLTLENTGTINGTWSLAISSGSWLSASQTAGSLTGGNTTTDAININSAGLAAGTYTSDIAVTFTPSSGAAIVATCTVALTITSSASHLFYTMTAGTVYCYDMDNNFALKKQVNVNQLAGGIRGCACDPAANALYLAYGGDGGGSSGGLLSYNLLNDTINYAVNYNHGIDQLAVSPDGTTIYMPEGELASGSLWHVVNAATGAETGTTISGGTGPHNTLVSLDGANVYLGPRFDPHLSVYNIASKTIIKKAGPVSHGDGIRPFTINKAQTLAFITMSGFLGFDVWDISTNSPKRLFTVSPPGFSGSGWGGTTPCHGISLSPDESEVWLLDAPNAFVHVFNITGLPGTAPTDVADIALSRTFNHNETPCAYDCPADGWLLHSLDGNYVFVGDEGDVISTATRKMVVNLSSLYNTRHGFVEVTFAGGKAVATSTHFGLGYGSIAFPSLALSPTTLAFTGTVGSASPDPQTVVLTNTGPTTGAWSSSITYGGGASGWLSFTPTTGTLAPNAIAALPMTVSLGTLVAGSYSATVTYSITAGGQTATATLTVTLTLLPATGNTIVANPGDNLTAKASTLGPGDILSLNSGTFKESHGLLLSGLHGTATAPITIQATTDGQATIDGGGTTLPLRITDSSWIVVQGLRLQNSSGSVCRIDTTTTNCSNITMRRCSTTGAASGNWHDFDIEQGAAAVGPDHITLEDCAALGRGRYGFLAYHTNNVTFRRCFSNHPFATNFTPAPRSGFGVYGSAFVILENCIGYDDLPDPSSSTDYYTAVWQTTDDATNWPQHDATYLGCIFWNNWEGLYIDTAAGANTNITNCLFLNNGKQGAQTTTKDHGDGIQDDATATKTITNCTFVGNENGFYGNADGNTSITNSSFYNNQVGAFKGTHPATEDYNDVYSNQLHGLNWFAYFYATDPNNTSAYWQEATGTQPLVPRVFTLNPNNGPGSSQDTKFVANIASAHANGQWVIGYVNTSNFVNVIPLATVKADIDKWYSFYNIDGIMFDTAICTSANLSYYTTLYNYVKAKSSGPCYVVANPASFPPESYVSTPALDTVNTYEGEYNNFVNSYAGSVPSWASKYSPDHFGVIVGTVPDATSVQKVVNIGNTANVGRYYISNSPSQSAYSTMPPQSYFTNVVNDVYALNQGGSSGGGGGTGTHDVTVNPGFSTATYGNGGYCFIPTTSPLKGAGQSGANIGATILYRYVNGSLTSTPLWPWPMEGRIVAEQGVSVTYDSNGGLFTTLAGLYSGTITCGSGASATLAEAGAIGVSTGGSPVPNICLVALENYGYDASTGAKFVIGNASFPNLNNYFKTYGAATKFYALNHNSLPNYLGFASGVDHSNDSSVDNDSYNPTNNPFTDTTLVESMANASPPVTWKHYAENLPSTGYLGGDTGGYIQHHDPWVYFKGIRNSTALASHIVNYSSASVGLAADLAAGTAPSFFFVQPNNGDNGHTGTAAACDAWVKKFVDMVQASTWYTQGHGNIILWFDESNKGDTSGIGDDPNGGHIYVVVINAENNAVQFTTAVNHYGLLGTIERLYGLPLLGNSAHSVNGNVDNLILPPSGGGGGGGGSTTISVTPAALSFTGPAGGATAGSQTVTVSNANAASAAAYTTTSSQPWLTVSPTTGSIPAGGSVTASITATIGSLVAGTYTGTITYVGPTNTVVVSVTLTVTTVSTGTTPLTAYLTGLPDSLLSTANKVFTSGGGTSSVANSTLIGTGVGYGELYSQGTSAPWASGTSVPAPSGHGWLLDVPTLEGHDLQAGAYVGTLSLNIGGVGAQAIQSDIHIRAYKRTSSGTYHLLTDGFLTAQNICPVPRQITINVSTSTATSFVAGDKLYIDVLLNILVNTGPSTMTVVVGFLSTDTSALRGSSQAALATPGYLPTSGGGPPPLPGGLPGQFFTNGVSNYLFGTNMSQDFAANTVRNTPAIQAQIQSAGFTVMRCAIPNGSTDSYLDLTANACLACNTAMLVILSSSDNTWNQHVVTYLGSRCKLYEVGNEPDINGVSVATYSANWNSFIPVLRGINPNAAFIGPALGVFANVNSYLVPWLQNCKTSGILPNAVSYHVYPCTSPTCDQTCCTPLSGNFQNDANTLKSAVSGVLGSVLPICLTEWNIDASNPMKAYTLQNPFNSTWIAAAIDSMVAGKIDMACQWDAAGNAGGGTADLISTQAPYPQQVEYPTLVSKIAQYMTAPPACPPNCPPPGATPLSLYGTIVDATTLTTASMLVTPLGTGTEVPIATSVGQATGYGELWSNGNNAAWPALGTIGAPSGNGWLLDEPILDGNTIQQGKWNTQLKLNLSGFASSTPPMPVPLTVYGTSASATTLPSAGTLVSTTGGTIGHSETHVGNAVRYGELYALGNSANWPALASMGTPTGHGFLWDVTTLEMHNIAAGNWSPAVRMYISTLGGSIQADIHLNAYKRSSSGVYTTIGTFSLAGQTITRTSTNYTLVSQSLAAVSFVAGDKLYVDVWLNITVNAASDSSMHVNLALSTTGAGGLANEVQTITPGYLPQVTPPPSGSFTADIILRAYSYNSGVYTAITTFTLLAQTISGAVAVFLPPPASVGLVNFNTGDRLYVDLWLNVTSNALMSPGLSANVALSSIAQGLSSDLALTTPGYVSQGGVVVTATPPSLTFSDSVGGSSPSDQTVLLTNTRTLATVFDAHTSADWLLVFPASGVVPASGSTPVGVSVETGQLAAGTYTGTVSFLSSGGVTDLSVVFTVLASTTQPGGQTGFWQCLLANQDITNYVDPTSIDIDDTMGSQSATGSSLPIATRAGTIQLNTSLGPMSAAIGRGNVPKPGRPQLVRLGEIVVYDNSGTIVFGGYATKYTDTTMLNPHIGASLQPFTTINGIDYDASLDRVLVNESFVNQTDLAILTAIFHKYVPWVDLSLLPTTPNYTYPGVVFTNVTVLGVLQAVQGITGFLAWVDYRKRLHYVSPAASNSAPFALSDAPDFVTSFPHNVQEFIIEDTAAINRVFFRGGRKISNDFKQDVSMYANGANTVFPLAYRGIHEAADGIYHVTLNGVGLVVGLVGSGGPRNTLKPDGLADVILDPDAGTLTFAVPPALGASVFAVYRYNFPMVVVATDEKSHAFFGDPYMDGVINDTNVFDATTALQRCRVLLSQKSFGQTTLKMDTWTAGLQSGQTIHVTNKVRGINATYLIQDVETEWYAATGSKPGGFVYHVTVGAWNWNVIDIIVRLAASASSALPTANAAGTQETVEQVLPTYAALTVSTSWSIGTTTTVPHIAPYYARALYLGDGHDAFPGFATCGG